LAPLGLKGLMVTPGMGYPKMSLISPTVKHTGQESGVELCEMFQILIVPAVKFCRQCLQTASASKGFRRHHHHHHLFAFNKYIHTQKSNK